MCVSVCAGGWHLSENNNNHQAGGELEHYTHIHTHALTQLEREKNTLCRFKEK